jgi:sec-independent protein translocase protein TatA
MNFPTCIAFIDGLGGPELLMIAFVALVLFGGKNLPSLARTMGKTMREFKKASSEVEREIRKAIDETPDPDAPVKPVATVAQYQSMPTSTPVPSPYPEYPSDTAQAHETAASLAPATAPVSTSAAGLAAAQVAAPSQPAAAPAAPASAATPGQPAVQAPEISRHRIEPSDV